ncbi:serine/threonine-protein kinase RIO3-like [Oscarella lobularis]|uniref:serine/threonine-protein kinase RIO3-like n=1 Tax=Oscarella lobularis TaxID=121494 RepID=UPI0033137FBB
MDVVEAERRPTPWKRVTPEPSNPSACSLAVLMDEEMARTMQESEKAAYEEASALPLIVATENETQDDDLLLAQLLQSEFDAEYDRYSSANERHMNGNKKVSISFRNYRHVPSTESPDDDEDDYDVIDEMTSRRSPAAVVSPSTSTSSSSKSRRRRKWKQGVPTKHDLAVCGRKNVERVASLFPPDFATGDVTNEADDFCFSNRVYTALKRHSIKEEKQAQRVFDKKDRSTHNLSLDPQTRLILFKLVSSDTLSNVNGCLATGKESSVYHAFGGRGKEGECPVPRECAVKVFKTTLNEFKSRDKYIRDDHRFRLPLGRQNPRKIIRIWTEKEARNLRRMEKANIRCPRVITHKKHVLVMGFIGDDQRGAPQLKDAKLDETNARLAYTQCISMMKVMYDDARLVHGDLSEFNMLWHGNEVYFIDVSQSVEPSHPHAFDFLYHDCVNVVEFFRRLLGVERVLSASELFVHVCGVAMASGEEAETLGRLKAFNKRESRREEEGKMFREDLQRKEETREIDF